MSPAEDTPLFHEHELSKLPISQVMHDSENLEYKRIPKTRTNSWPINSYLIQTVIKGNASSQDQVMLNNSKTQAT